MIDIVIVNYNSTDYLLRCLRSVYNSLQEFPAKVFVEDNASEDGVDRVKSEFPQVILSKNSYNMGFARAVNNVLKQSDSPYVVLLNPDTYVMDGFFEPILRYMEENLDVVIVGPKILNYDGSVQGSARSFPTPLTGLFGRSSLLSRFLPKNQFTRANILTTRSDGKTPMEVDWVSGACMVVRRKAVDDVGLLDERFFMYWEDADWCRRMRGKGGKVVYFPQASVVHYVGVSSEQTPLRSILQFHKSSYRLFDKYGKASLWFVKPLAMAGIFLHLCYVLVSMPGRVWYEKLEFVRKRLKEARVLEKGERIKVLRMIARLNIGGPAIHVHLLTKGLDAKRFESTLVVGKLSPQEGDMSYLFDSTHKKPLIIPELQKELNLIKDIKSFFAVLKILGRDKPDIVHTHTAKAGAIGRIAALAYKLIHRRKVRIVHTFHGHVFEGYFSKTKSLLFVLIEGIFGKITSQIIVVSETQRKDFLEKYRIAPSDKVRVIQLGFDLKPFFGSNVLKGHFRKGLGISEDTFLIGIVGRLVPIKNHRMFLQASRMFLDQNPGSRVKFVLLGDGELKEDLEAYCQTLGLSSHVLFCGWIKDIPALYADLNVLALTSINEGTPVSVIEAMASSVPVIATDVGGMRDLLGAADAGVSSDGFVLCKRGILCRTNDALGFTKGLNYLAKVNGRENEDRVKRAKSFVNRSFSERRLLRDIESLYLELMES